MGNRNYKISNWHFLHYMNATENKLYLFDCEKELFHILPIFKDEFPFFPGYLNSISIEFKGLIYFVGGLGFKETPMFNYNVDIENDSENGENIFYEQKKEKKNNKHENYAKTFKAVNDMEELNFIGYLNINLLNKDMLTIIDEGLEQLPIEINNHNLFFESPFIYIIGGFHNNEPNHKCYKFNIENKKIENICSLNTKYQFSNTGGIIVKNNIYLFLTKGSKQTIHKYLIEFDLWEAIELRTDNFKIPFSYNPTIYQFDSENLIYLNGESETNEELIDYYIFNLEKDEFISLRTDRVLSNIERDNQGSKNYENSLKIFGNMNDKELKIYDKADLMWKKLELKEFSNDNPKRGCIG